MLAQATQRAARAMRDLHESQRFLQGIRDYSPNAIVIKSLEAVLDPCDLRARASPRRREPSCGSGRSPDGRGPLLCQSSERDVAPGEPRSSSPTRVGARWPALSSSVDQVIFANDASSGPACGHQSPCAGGTGVRLYAAEILDNGDQIEGAQAMMRSCDVALYDAFRVVWRLAWLPFSG